MATTTAAGRAAIVERNRCELCDGAGLRWVGPTGARTNTETFDSVAAQICEHPRPVSRLDGASGSPAAVRGRLGEG